MPDLNSRVIRVRLSLCGDTSTPALYSQTPMEPRDQVWKALKPLRLRVVFGIGAYIVRVNRPLLWINILGLLFVALIPFSTAMLGEYFLNRFAVLFYGANLFLAACGGFVMWWYAASHKMLGEDVGPEIVMQRKRASLITIAALLVATLAAFISTYISLALFVLIALLSLLPERKNLHSSIQ